MHDTFGIFEMFKHIREHTPTHTHTHEHTYINMQTDPHTFGMISHNKNETGKAEKPPCVCMLKDRETHIFREVRKVT